MYAPPRLQDEGAEDGLLSAEELNEMLARTDDEKELFDEVDMEEDRRLREAGHVSAPAKVRFIQNHQSTFFFFFFFEQTKRQKQ